MGVRLAAGHIQSLNTFTPGLRAETGASGGVRRVPSDAGSPAVAGRENATGRFALAAPSRDALDGVTLATAPDSTRGQATGPGDSAVLRAQPRTGDGSDVGERAEARGTSTPQPTTRSQPRAGSAGSAGLFNGGFRFAATDAARREFELIAAQATIERQLVREAGVRFGVDDPDAIEGARRDVAALRRQAQAIEREISRLRLARLAEAATRLIQPPPNALGPQRASVGTPTGVTPSASAAAGTGLLNLVV